MDNMKIFARNNKVIGYLTYRELPSKESIAELLLVPFVDNHHTIIHDIHSKIDVFPIIELTDISITNKRNRRKRYGSMAIGKFLEYAKVTGYRYAVVKIGKHSIHDSLDGHTDFYTRNGWNRFVAPSEFSPRFAYYDLSKLSLIHI